MARVFNVVFVNPNSLRIHLIKENKVSMMTQG